MKFTILTLFPGIFRSFMDESILRRGQDNGSITIETSNIRDYSELPANKVDDIIYGGGAGMLMRPEPTAAAITAALVESPEAHVIYMSPSGQTLTQERSEELAAMGKDLIIVCGRYEGLDQRVRATMIDEEISIGDYVLSGGELAAGVLVDTVARHVPGVVGDSASVERDSFSAGLYRTAEFPQFTRPRVWNDMSVPEALTSGDHARIEDWQLAHLPHMDDEEMRILRTRRKVLPTKTRNLYFRLPEEGDVDAWTEWFNDMDVTRHLRLSPPVTREDEEEYLRDSAARLDSLLMSVCDKKTKKPIGNMRLELYPQIPGSATLGFVIGDKEFWGRGLCQEAMRELLRIGFEELELEMIFLDVFASNIAARKCYEKVGFREVGTLRKMHLKDEISVDGVLYDITHEDFFAKYGE